MAILRVGDITLSVNGMQVGKVKPTTLMPTEPTQLEEMGMNNLPRLEVESSIELSDTGKAILLNFLEAMARCYMDGKHIGMRYPNFPPGSAFLYQSMDPDPACTTFLRIGPFRKEELESVCRAFKYPQDDPVVEAGGAYLVALSAYDLGSVVYISEPIPQGGEDAETAGEAHPER